MTEEIILRGAKCLGCGSLRILLLHRVFPYQTKNGHRVIATDALEIITAVCLECKKTFISEGSLPPDFVQGLVSGKFNIDNPTETKILVISNLPIPYTPTV